MRRVLLAATLALLLGGCASYAWVKPDVTAEVRARDEDSCRAEARDLANEYAYGGFGAPPLYSPGPRPWMGPAAHPPWHHVCARDRRLDVSPAPACSQPPGYYHDDTRSSHELSPASR